MLNQQFRILSLFSFLLPLPGLGFGCTCKNIPSSIESRTKSETIFLGSVISTKEIAGDSQDAEIQPIAYWKGTPRQKVRLRGGGLCGLWFEPNRSYILYGDLEKDGSSVSACSLSSEFRSATTDIEQLGTPASQTEPIFPFLTGGLSVKLLRSGEDLSLEFVNRSDRRLRLPSWDALSRVLSIIVIEGDANRFYLSHLVAASDFVGNLAPRQSEIVRLKGWRARESLDPRRARPFRERFRTPGNYTLFAAIDFVPAGKRPEIWHGRLVSETIGYEVKKEGAP